MIKKILNNHIILNSKPSKSVVSAAFVITIAGLASRILGLLRDRILASTFGADAVLDSYYAAFRIPDLIYNLLILGALSAAFIPVFTGLVSKDKEKEAWEMANNIINLALLFICSFSILFFIFAHPLMKLIAPGFSEDRLNMATHFTRIMFLSPIFLGLSGILGSILTSYKRFLIYSLAPIMYNIGIIIGVVFFEKIIGPSGLAWGVAFGAFLHLIIQYPAVRHLGFSFKPRIKGVFLNRNVRKVLFLMVPRVLGVAVNQINLLIITIFASTLATGSLAIFNFAQNLQSVPLGLVGISFSIAVFPVLSSLAAQNKNEEFIIAFSKTFRQILFFVIPISIFALVLRAQIVRVVLGSGKFDWQDTILTFQCLGIFSLSLFAQSTIPLLARSFYALHNTKTPFYVALFTEALNITAVFLLIGKFKIIGLVIAFSFSSIIQMIILLFILRLKFENLDDKNIIKSVLKISIASFLSGISIQFSKIIISGMVNMDTFIGVFIQLSISLLIGIFIFSAISYFIKLEEFFVFKKSFEKRMFGMRKVIEEDIKDVSGI